MKKDDKQLQEKGFGVIELDDEQLEGVMGGVDDINLWKCVDTQNTNCVAGCACSP